MFPTTVRNRRGLGPHAGGAVRSYAHVRSRGWLSVFLLCALACHHQAAKQSRKQAGNVACWKRCLRSYTVRDYTMCKASTCNTKDKHGKLARSCACLHIHRALHCSQTLASPYAWQRGDAQRSTPPRPEARAAPLSPVAQRFPRKETHACWHGLHLSSCL